MSSFQVVPLVPCLSSPQVCLQFLASLQINCIFRPLSLFPLKCVFSLFSLFVLRKCFVLCQFSLQIGPQTTVSPAQTQIYSRFIHEYFFPLPQSCYDVVLITMLIHFYEQYICIDNLAQLIEFFSMNNKLVFMLYF